MFHEIDTFRSAIARVDKYREARKQVERRLDLQYRRKVAEALDSYQKPVQRRACQEKAGTEAKREAGDQRKAAEEEKLTTVAVTWSNGEAAERHRLKKLQELEATNQWLKPRCTKDFSSFENHISRVISQICGIEDNAIAKANKILEIFKDTSCPLSIKIAAFAKKMLSACGNPYACSYVIVHVTSQFPQAMDTLLAEFHRACVYTVPKHNIVINSLDKPGLDSDAYYEGLDSMMRLYGALVQIDLHGNIHGVEHGWAWLARFLSKTTSHDRATATVLNAFLQTAGLGLHQRYKSQFLIALDAAREHFLAKFRAEENSSDLQTIITDITAYLDDRMYLEEPQGRRTMRTETTNQHS